jgi:catalase
VTRDDLRERVFAYWTNVDADLGARVRAAVAPSAPGSNEDPEKVAVEA